MSMLDCLDLKVINLSRNHFNGNIPPKIGNLEHLKIIKLNQNDFWGSIPSRIFNGLQIEELMLQANALIGSIPTQVGNLKNAKIISMSNNLLKGAIPTEFEALKHIKQLQLHNNHLAGLAPRMESLQNGDNNDYITDCGEPWFTLSAKLECTTCTMCCNSDLKCQKNQNWPIPFVAVAFMVAFLIPTGLAIQYFVSYKARFPMLTFSSKDREGVTLFQRDSVYSFMFSNSHIARLLDVATMGIQIWLLTVFLEASNFQSLNTDWRYSFQCPRSSLECTDEAVIKVDGWMLFVIVTVFHLSTDFVRGVMQVQKGVTTSNINLFIGGFRLLLLTTLALFTSGYYNLALAVKTTDLIMNAVILLFINDLDEQLFRCLEALAPDWIQERLIEIEENLSTQVGVVADDLEPGQDTFDKAEAQMDTNNTEQHKNCRVEAARRMLGFIDST